MRKPTIWVPTRSDTNQPVQSQKKAKNLEILGMSRGGIVLSLQWPKTKALISFAVTAKLTCIFVFEYANCWFSYATAHIVVA